MFFNTSIRVAWQVFVFHFSCVVGSALSRETRGQFWSQFLVSPLSQQVLNTCVINVDLCFVLLHVCADQVQNSSRTRTDCLTSGVFCHPCTNREVQSSVPLVSAEPVRELSFLLSHQEKCCVLSHPFVLHPFVLFSWLFRTVPAW